MEIIIVILIIIIIVLSYKVHKLSNHLTVLSFSVRNINKLLVKKNLITLSEIDTVINESIGDMDENVGNKIIKSAKDIGITIPKYMGESELEKYLKEQELKRVDRSISFTDRMIIDEEI